MSRRRRLGRAFGYLGALPVSAVAAAVIPFVIVTGGSVRARSGVLEAAGGLLRPLLERGVPGFPISAITLGHVVLARDPRALDATRAHERIHVDQYERFGALFPFLYLAASLQALWRGGRAYGDNRFEREACMRSGEGIAA